MFASIMLLQVGLGTDVAGGYSASMLDCIRQTMIATNVCGMEPDENGTKWKPLRCGCKCMGFRAAIGVSYRSSTAVLDHSLSYSLQQLFC